MHPLGIVLLVGCALGIFAAELSPAKLQPCPDFCICDLSTGTAKCQKLDPNRQHFGSNIKSLHVKTTDSRTVVTLEPNMFKRMGLRYVNTILINNSTIGIIDPQAFVGLPHLSAVDLRSNGLSSIPVDLFKTNTRLKKINLSNNPLQQTDGYFLNTIVLEEIILANANFTFITDKTFSKSPGVIYINVSQNKITAIDDAAFNNLVNLEEVDLSFNKISEISGKFFLKNEELSVLKLQNNPIQSIDNIKSDSLETLDVTNCQISKIEESSFIGVPNLIDLILASNRIESIHVNSLQYLTELFTIDVSGNNLTEIPPELFFHNIELTSINIGHNPLIRSLPPNGFVTKSEFRISTFIASKCSIQEVNESNFINLDSLQELSLNGNNISVINNTAFSKLLKLELLDLSSNQLTNPSSLIFQNNTKLRHLNLSKNPWKILPGFIFRTNQNLVWLDLSDCQLSDLWWGVPKNANERLISLNFLNISSNLLTKITPQQLELIPNIGKIDLSNNPLECSDDLSTLIQWLDSRSVQLPNHPTHLPKQLLEQSNEFSKHHSRWQELALSVCGESAVPELKTTKSPAPGSTRHFEEEDIIQINSNNNLEYEDETYGIDYDYDHSTQFPGLDIDMEGRTEVTAMLMKYANYTYVIMFIIGAITSATIFGVIFYMFRNCWYGKRPQDMMMISTLTQMKTKKDCGLVYKQLSEEIPNTKTNKIGMLYSPFYDLAYAKNPKPSSETEQV